MDAIAPILLLKGNDEVLLGAGVSDLLDELVGDQERYLLVEELTIDDHITGEGEEYDIGRIVDAAQTPPFLTDRRIVLSRHAAVFSTKELVAPLVAYLRDPLPTTTLVLVWEKDPRPQRGGKLATVPKTLLDAITAAGGAVVDTSAGTGRAQSEWFSQQLTDSSLRFDAASERHLADHIGGEMGRLPGVVRTLEGVFPAGMTVSIGDIEPFLGEAGDVPPWDLTDAIDSGDVQSSLEVLARMLGGGSRHPLQILAVLTTHYLRMLQVDSPEIRGEKMAAERLGIVGKQSTFPAKKALASTQRLGSDRVGEFIELLAEADLDLHGARSWPPELVMEVLVARLAGRSRGARGSRR